MIFRMLVDLTAFSKLLSIKSQNSSLTRIKSIEKINKYCLILSYKVKIPLFSFDQTYCVMKVKRQIYHFFSLEVKKQIV